MLTINRCRQILGSACVLTDAEIETVRNSLTEFANLALDNLLTQTSSNQESDSWLASSLRYIPANDHDGIIERASIMEHDGGLLHDEANRAALALYVKGKMQ